jgi:dihydroorotase
LPPARPGIDEFRVAFGVSDTIDPERFLSKGRATPFAGWTVHARILRTTVDCGTVFAK